MNMKNHTMEGYGINLWRLKFKKEYDLEELAEKLSIESVCLDYETSCPEAVYLMLCPRYPWDKAKDLPKTQEEVFQLIWKLLKEYVNMSMEDVSSFMVYIDDVYYD